MFQQTVGIPMDTNCAPLFFLQSHEAEFIRLCPRQEKQHVGLYIPRYRYIDEILSINHPDFQHNLGQKYPVELEIKDQESITSASCLHLLLSIGRDGQQNTYIFDKRDYFNIHTTNFPILNSNIPSSPAFHVFSSP